MCSLDLKKQDIFRIMQTKQDFQLKNTIESSTRVKKISIIEIRTQKDRSSSIICYIIEE